MTIYSTIMILSLQLKKFNFSDYELCLRLLVDNIQSLRNNLSLPVMISINTQSISMFNRFFLQDADSTLQFVQNNSDLDTFINEYVFGIEKITAKKALKINAIANMMALNKFPLQSVINHFGFFINGIVREVILFYEESQGNGSKNRKVIRDRRKNFSLRKEELHNLQMYNEYNLVDLFKESMNVRNFLEKFKLILNRILSRD